MDYKLPKDYKLPDDYTNLDIFHRIYQAHIEPDLQGMLQSTKEQMENYILAQIKMAVNVDKEELIKALKYDRDQYNKGYQNAKAQYDRGHGHWIDKYGDCICSCCERPISDMYDALSYISCGPVNDLKYCPFCGAEMDEEEEVE